MKTTYADLHIHSHYSRATSAECTLEGLYHWAQLKGVGLVGTGDCTHPVWLAELENKLIPAEAPGFYTLSPELQQSAGANVPDSCHAPVNYMITGEVSSIYSRGGKVRKVHSIVTLPSLEAASRLSARLAQVGNVLSDGRPTLGLDPRKLLEILLEIDPLATLIPAHIWTPWFSMLGARSGFDSIEECFGDLTPHIFAVETGLSSDPPMNHRIRFLDDLTLISNSDLHSPSALGRNANIFYGDLSYPILIKALRSGDTNICGGTVDLFPEEGKYYLDGHRTCGVRLEPDESMAMRNHCPACNRKLTIGVLHRVLELERNQASPTTPAPTANRLPWRYTIPLPQLLEQSVGYSKNSKAVKTAYMQLLDQAGPELPLLLDLPQSELNTLGDAGALISGMRAGRVTREGGFDGEYGSVRVELP